MLRRHDHAGDNGRWQHQLCNRPFILLLLATFLLPQQVFAQRGAGDTLRLFFWQAPTIANPLLAPGLKDLTASRLAYEPLASFDAEDQLVPVLAAEIPTLDNGGVAADGHSVTWKLKAGVQWADGTAFTADDVVFTYEFLTNPATGAILSAPYKAIENIQALDEHTLKITFKTINPAWASLFVGKRGAIIPRHIFAPYNGANAVQAPANLKPIGTGPYRGVDFKTEDILLIGEDVVNTVKITYEPNPFFREPDKPYFSRVELRGGGGDAGMAAQHLADGMADFALNLQTDDVTLAAMEASGKAKAVQIFGPQLERIMLNFTDPNRVAASGERSSVDFPHPFLSDAKVRRAIMLAIDRPRIAALYGRRGRLASNFLISLAHYNSPNTKIEFNPSKARTLLDQAGWHDHDGDGVRDKDGVALRALFQTSVSGVRQQTQHIVKENLEAIGFAIELKFIDASIFFGPTGENTNTLWHFYADMQEFMIGSPTPDPAFVLHSRTCSQASQKANNWALNNRARFCDPAYDALYQQSTMAIDPQQRQQLMIAMNDYLIDKAVMIPLVNLANIVGVSNSLSGLQLSPWDLEVWNIKDWRRRTP